MFFLDILVNDGINYIIVLNFEWLNFGIGLIKVIYGYVILSDIFGKFIVYLELVIFDVLCMYLFKFDFKIKLLYNFNDFDFFFINCICCNVLRRK